MTYLETRSNDNGTAFARVHQAEPEREESSAYDLYIEPVGDGGTYESLEDWCVDELLSDGFEDPDVLNEFLSELESGEWVEITDYI